MFFSSLQSLTNSQKSISDIVPVLPSLCEERSDEAIQYFSSYIFRDCSMAPEMTYFINFLQRQQISRHKSFSDNMKTDARDIKSAW